MTEVSAFQILNHHREQGKKLDPEHERNRAASMLGVKRYMTELSERMGVNKSVISLALTPNTKTGTSKRPTRLFEIHKLLNRLENSDVNIQNNPSENLRESGLSSQKNPKNLEIDRW